MYLFIRSMITDRKIFVYCYFEMNVLRWCPFVHLFDTLFQNSPYGHGMIYVFIAFPHVEIKNWNAGR